MDKEKISNYLFWMFILIILVLQVFTLFNSPEIPPSLEPKMNWSYGWICTENKFKSPEDAKNGWNCLLEQCEVISDDPLRWEECICVLNNLTVNRVCTKQLYIRTYNYPTFNKPIQINVSQQEYNDITIGNKSINEVL